MNDDNPHSSNGSAQSKSFFEKIKDTFSPEPQSTEDLVEVISEAQQNDVIDPQTREMIEGCTIISIPGPPP